VPAKRPRMYEITQEFGFDAAHHLNVGPEQNRRLHGHSFSAEVTLRGEPDVAAGVVRDLGEVKAILMEIAASLDHQLLNEVEGLGAPTLENLARYIFARAKAKLPDVVRVRLRRPSHGQSCVFEET
jgi:6-pyruvoyltetrahydropterin/6-carboxytetrahydropterin synthase